MALGTLIPTPYQTVLDANGNPVSGALIYTYFAGTTTPQPTYTDVALAVPNANPIVADSAGRYVAFLSPDSSYKLIIKDAASVTIRTQDNILTVGTGSLWLINVKDSPYNAKGDGVTDDTAAILAATTAATAAGQSVYFPAGTFRVTLTTFAAAVRTCWIGAGRGNTTLKLIGGTGTAIAAVWSHLRSEWYSEISHMTIDGNGGAGPLISLNAGGLIIMRDVTLTNLVGTALSLTSIFDSHFENVYVESCGDATHPCVVLDSNPILGPLGGDAMNNCNFYNCHVEPGPVDAILWDIVGNAVNQVLSNSFYGLKLHGDPATSLPNRPVLRIGAFGFQNQFYSPIIAFGKSTSQVELSGSYNHFYSPIMGLGATPPQCAFDLIGGGNRIVNAILGNITYTVTYFRNTSNENVVLWPRMGAGGPVVYTSTAQFRIDYREPATGVETFFSTLGRRIVSYTDFGQRVAFSAGAAVAAANDLTLGFGGNLFHITGATQINAIITSFWQAGSEITLIFDSTPTVKHNTAGGAGTAKILLAGAADFVATANDLLCLIYDGTSWFEKGRSVI